MEKKIPLSIVVLLSGIIIVSQANFLPHDKIVDKYTEEKALTVFKPVSTELPTFNVQHETKGNQVFVECILTGISFRQESRQTQKTAKMVVWIDGVKQSEMNSAVFIIKGLSAGSHRIKLEVFSLENQPMGLAKEFMVNIPK